MSLCGRLRGHLVSFTGALCNNCGSRRGVVCLESLLVPPVDPAYRARIGLNPDTTLCLPFASQPFTNLKEGNPSFSPVISVHPDTALHQDFPRFTLVSMDSDTVSDSEPEDLLEILLPDLQEVLKRRGNAAVKRTNVLPTSQFNFIQDTINTESRTRLLFDDLFDDESNTVRRTQLRYKPLPLVTEPSIHNRNGLDIPTFDDLDAAYRNRGTRRRHRSFYQQHIYTIDSVAYMLKISLEQATDMVKADMRMIDEYHAGTLRNYLKEKSDGKKPNQSRPKAAVNRRRIVEESQDLEQSDGPARSSQPLMDVPMKDLMPDENDEAYGENENASAESTDTSSGSDEGSEEEEQEDPVVVFRGRAYKSIEQVSRGSGLPKSYYSMQIKTHPKVKQTSSKRSRLQENRAGVARKKTRLPGALPTVPEQEQLGTFTTGDDSQDTQQGTQDSLVYMSETSTQAYTHSRDDMLENYLDDTLMFSNSSASTETFHRVAHHQNTYYDDGGEAMEDNRSEFMPMLASIERKKRSGYITSRHKKGPGTVPLTLKSRKVQRRPGSVSKIVDTPKKSSIPRRKTPQKQSVTQSLVADSPSTPHRPKILKRQYTPQNATGVTTHNEKNPIGASRYKCSTPSTPFGRLPKQKSKQTPKKYYFVQPGVDRVLPRQAQMSTVVYETLGHEFAIIPNKRPTASASVIEVDDYPSHYLLQAQEDDAALRTGFQMSLAYKCLFTNERVDADHDYSIVLGSKTIVFSRLLQNTEEKLNELFDTMANVSALRLTSEQTLMNSFHHLLVFCSSLPVNEAKSLVTMVDNFRFKLESLIRRTGRMKDIDFYYLGLSYMLYYCSLKVFETNYLSIFDFKIKAKDILSLFFEFVGYIDGHIIRRKLKAYGLFSESLSMLFLTHQDLTWSAIQQAHLKDLEFFKEICALYGCNTPQWDVVRSILKRDILSSRPDKLRRDFLVINDLVSQLHWDIDDQTLLVMFDILKSNKFGNFLGEPNRPEILSESGLDKDTIANIYINILMEYGESGGKLNGRFLERATPVSKVSSDLTALCNRLNILLALLIASKKNFDLRFAELFSACDFGSAVVIKCAVQAFDVMVRVNNAYGMSTKMYFLGPMIERLSNNSVFVDSWKTFIGSTGFMTLNLQTQKNLLSAIAPFSSQKSFFQTNVDIVRNFTIQTQDKNVLVFLRDTFNELNPSLFPDLWCLLFGKLVRLGVDNWSRLIHFNNFDDEPRMYAFILQTSGSRIYTLERDRFVLSLISHLVQRKYSSSLNAFLWEISKLDPKLLNCKSVLVQTHRLQITINLVYNLLRNDSVGVRARFLAVIINFVKKEYDESLRKKDPHYESFARKVIEFINLYGYEYVRSSKAFEHLSKTFKLEQRATENDSKSFLNLYGNVGESLTRMEEKLISSFKTNEDFCSVVTDAILSHKTKPLGAPETITESKIYCLCCSISVHIESLSFSPSCWILLAELTKVLARVIERDHNVSPADMFCLLKILRLFPFALKHRKTRYEVFEIVTLKNIYQLLFLTFHMLDGTNEQKPFVEMAIQFTSSDAIYEIICPIGSPHYLIKMPEYIRTMVSRANLTGYDRAPSFAKVKDDLDDLFNQFASSVEAMACMFDEEFVEL